MANLKKVITRFGNKLFATIVFNSFTIVLLRIGSLLVYQLIIETKWTH